MIPVFVDAGFRVVAPDLIGFGRSDKPTTQADYTYARHVEWMRSVLFDTLDLSGITLVCQDWGGLIGLRLVAEHPQRFARVCAANTGLPDGTVRLPEAWWQFRDFVQRTPTCPSGCWSPGGSRSRCRKRSSPPTTPRSRSLLQSRCAAFPDLIPQSLDNPATPDNQKAWSVLETFTKPFLCAFSDQDPITRGGDRTLLARIPGTKGQPHTTIEGGGHFLQEDRGVELANVVIGWAQAG